MSRQYDEERYPAKRKTSGKPAQYAGNRPYTFHPTKAQRESIRADTTTLGAMLDHLGGWTRQGCKIVLGYRAESNAHYALIREGGEDFSMNKAVSCWHGNLATAAAMLYYYLAEVNTGWPTVTSDWVQEEFDW